MERIGYIYALLDPRDRQIRYIGKTIHKAESRYKEHIASATRPAQNETHCRRWIRRLIKDGYRPILVVLRRCPVGRLSELERSLIAAARSWGARLTNITAGGEGLDSETASRLLKQRWKDPEQRAAFIASCIGRRHSKESLRRISEGVRKRFDEKQRRERSRALALEMWADPLKRRTLLSSSARRERDGSGRFI